MFKRLTAVQKFVAMVSCLNMSHTLEVTAATLSADRCLLSVLDTSTYYFNTSFSRVNNFGL